MDLVGQHVREPEKLEGTLVRHDSRVLPYGEPRTDDFFPRRRRVLLQTVKTATDPNKTGGGNVMGKNCPAKPAVARLS